MPDGGASKSLLSYVGLGGAGICCLAIELVGGTAILGGLAATFGLSTGLTYLAVVGIGGFVAALLAFGYRQFGGASRV